MGSATGAAVAHLIIEWAKYLRAYGKKESTCRHYPRVAREWCAFLATRGKTYAEADYDDVDAYIVHASTVKNLKGWTIRGHTSILRRWYRWLRRKRYVWHDPFDAMEPVQAEAPLPNPLQESQTRELIEAEPHPLFRALWEVFYASGQRHTAVLNLRVSDLELERPDGRGRLRFTVGKRNRTKYSIIGRPAVAALRSFLAWRAEALARSKAPPSDDWLWVGLCGSRRLNCNTVRLRLRQAALRVGITERVYPHRLRHSTATHMLEGGADLRAVQETLGHATVATTQLYTLVSQKHLEQTFGASHPRA